MAASTSVSIYKLSQGGNWHAEAKCADSTGGLAWQHCGKRPQLHWPRKTVQRSETTVSEFLKQDDSCKSCVNNIVRAHQE